MSREFYGLEKGIDIYAENGDLEIRIITGTAAPIGTGEQSVAPIGSLYIRSGTGEFYQKEANAGAPGDWVLNGSASAVVGKWRSETVSIVTDDTQGAGTRDIVASPFSDDDGSVLLPADYIVGEYIISDADGSPALLEITAKGGTGDKDVTFAAAGTALVAEDTFVAKFYLPDADGGENRAIVNYNGSTVVKLGDIDWDFATGINLSSGYTAGNGSLSSADSVESGMEKLDGNQQDIQTASGIAQGAVDYGTFTGVTIPDASDNKEALQALETAHESLSSAVTEIDGNVDDLITLSGVAENATDLGTFTGTVIPDSSNNKEALQALETQVEANKQQGAGPADIAQNTPTVVDTVLVDDCQSVEWEVTAHDQGDPTNVQILKIEALHNGHAGADASLVKDNVFAKMKLGSNFNLQASAVISGSGIAQTIGLELETSDADGIRYSVRRTCVTAL